jgi:hemoglobin
MRVTETLYEHAGRDEGLHRLEEIFYRKALADPVLKTLFTKRVPAHVDHLTWFTAELFGGPDRFDEAGMPDDAPFRQAVREHVEFGAHVAQRNSWAETDADLHPIRQVPHWNWPQA